MRERNLAAGMTPALVEWSNHRRRCVQLSIL